MVMRKHSAKKMRIMSVGFSISTRSSFSALKREEFFIKGNMPSSEKPKKQQAAKGKAATQNASGGKAGHDLTAMKIHHDAKHPKTEWDESRYEDLQAKHGGSTQGVAVKGSMTAAKNQRR